MPEISRFYGIVIQMHFREHEPAHFHAVYGEFRASVEIESGLVRGTFPQKATQLVLAWTAIHRRELLENWQRSRLRVDLRRIPPLE